MVRARARAAGIRNGRRGVAGWPSQAARFCKRLRVPARVSRRAWRIFLGAPGFLQACTAIALAALVWFALDGIYQVVRKPSELFFPVSGTLNKTPAETWREYGPLFRSYS